MAARSPSCVLLDAAGWSRRSLLMALFALVCLGALGGRANAQLTQVVEDQKAPIPGAGHDYIHFLNETVNPAVGQVSLRISLPTPGGRGAHEPFVIEYNSNQEARFIPGSGGSGDNAGPWSGNGWSYLFPTLSVALEHQELSIPPSAGGPQSCTWYTNFLFTGLGGQDHDLEMAQLPPSWNDTEGCALLNPNLTGSHTTVLNGGDAKVESNSDGAWPFPTVRVADHGGTVYTFALGALQVNQSYYSLPTSVEDRNGNVINYASGSNGAVTVTDSDGRALISLSSFDSSSGDTVKISGVPAPYYTINWAAYYPTKLTTTPQTDPGNNANYCNAGGGLRYGNGQEISSIRLPDGQAYIFRYDSNSGLLQEVDWPSGASVVYTWEMSPEPNYGTPSTTYVDDGVSDQYVTSYLFYSNGLTSTYGECDGRYAIPVVTSRTVYDGGTEIEEQDFTYTTTWPSSWAVGGEPWTSRQANVVTHDKVSGQTSTTTYNYAPFKLPIDPEVDLQSGSNVEAVETEVDVCSGAVTTCTPTTAGFLRGTVQTRHDPQLPPYTVETHLDKGKVSEIDRDFNSNLEVSDLYQYDYGQGGHGPLLRHTHVDYASFAAPPDYPSPDIFNAPNDRIVCNASDRPVAETDYSYDGSSLTGAGVTVGRDAAYNGNSTAPRGNITSLTRYATVSGSSCSYSGASRAGGLTSTFTWDDTGNLLSSTDPLGNYTTYTWGDAANSPITDTRGFLTQVQYPDTSDPTLAHHVESYTWDYSTGHMLSHTGQNGNVTTFGYTDPNTNAADPFGRLRTITYPPVPLNGGSPVSPKTTIFYGDAPNGLYTEVQKTIDNNGHFTDSFTYYDDLVSPIM